MSEHDQERMVLNSKRLDLLKDQLLHFPSWVSSNQFKEKGGLFNAIQEHPALAEELGESADFHSDGFYRRGSRGVKINSDDVSVQGVGSDYSTYKVQGANPKKVEAVDPAPFSVGANEWHSRSNYAKATGEEDNDLRVNVGRLTREDGSGLKFSQFQAEHPMAKDDAFVFQVKMGTATKDHAGRTGNKVVVGFVVPERAAKALHKLASHNAEQLIEAVSHAYPTLTRNVFGVHEFNHERLFVPNRPDHAVKAEHLFTLPEPVRAKKIRLGPGEHPPNRPHRR
ncbi:MAG: hypothetical protein GOV15_02155 [Candidatus Diapherotrites archaeon]|nr:hypothetical protein [Candidatus Diapherotrites archaeon]